VRCHFEGKTPGSADAVFLRASGKRPLHVIVSIGLIRLYRLTLSSILGRGCRYLPTCSEFTEGAILRFGLWPGGWMGLARIASCNPWGGSGFDPVPEHLSHRYRWWLPWRGRA
jgi:putative membrane protein insertion efficiency factor